MIDQKTLKTIKAILFRYLDPREDKVFIFGSWAMGDARKWSDIDIGIESKRKIAGITILNIEEAFEESDMPYVVEVVNFVHVSEKFRLVAKQRVIYLN